MSTDRDALPAQVRGTVEAVWRIESGRIVAALARMLKDIGVAEEIAHDALVSAIEQWPGEGIPDNPGAWLMATAKHRAIDLIRRRALHQREEDAITRDLEERLGAAFEDPAAGAEEVIGDDLLRLIFTACHPVLAPEARAALTLRMVGGLATPEIARAFLMPEPTIAQRIVRAKRTLADAQVAFELPGAAELAERLESVLEVVYLIFNEGYSATSGSDWTRPTLCEEALRLGRMLAELAPGESEVHGLVALMELQASRLRARVAADGTPILLGDQNRNLWDQLLVRRGLAALKRAEALGGARGVYALQGAIAACHARSPSLDATDWPRVAALYDALAALVPSPVIELNRAVAVGRASGSDAGLAIVDALAAHPAMKRYHLLDSVRGDLLEKLGRIDEARAAFERAASLAQNAPEKELLLARASAARTPPNR